MIGTEQARCSNSAQVSNMSGVDTKSQSTERPQSSCSDKIPDQSQVNKNKENTELLTDTEICALTDKQSIQQVIDHFRPAIRTVLQEIDMCPDWDTSSLADTLGISRQDMTDILEGKHTQNVLPCFLRILASLNWAMSHSTLFSGERKYILPYNNSTAKLEFFIV